MSSFWTVDPETVKREGEWRGKPFWVVLKKQLTAGERLRMQTSGFRRWQAPPAARPGVAPEDEGARIEVDFERMALSRILTYVKEWSLENDKGQRLKIDRDVVETLHPDFIDALNGVINGHEAELEAEKKATTGGSEPSLKSA